MTGAAAWGKQGPEFLDRRQLLESRTLDGSTQELIYRPTLRTWPAG